MYYWNTLGFGGASGKEFTCQCRRDRDTGYLDLEDPQEKHIGTHSSILAWKIPQTEEPGGLQSMESQRIKQGWSDLACTQGFHTQ